MSKNSYEDWTESQRAEYASQVKTLRQDRGWTQQQLADRAEVSRQTIMSMENGSRTPQGELLARVLGIFGIQPDDNDFGEQTQLWLSMLGTLIEATPASRRQEAVDAAMRVLGRAVKGDVSGSRETDDLAVTTADEVKERWKRSDVALAAKRGKKHSEQ